MPYEVHITYRKCETVTDTHVVGSFGEVDPVLATISPDDVQAIAVNKYVAPASEQPAE